MKYVSLDTKKLVEIKDAVKEKFGWNNVPQVVPDSLLRDLNLSHYRTGIRPVYNRFTQQITLADTANLVDDFWIVDWIVTDLSNDKIEDNLIQAKIEVNAERDRRILLPKTVNITSGKILTVDMANGGRENIDSLAAAALAKQSLNITSTISFRDSSNNDWNLTNEDILEMGLQIVQQVEQIHIKARQIKAMQPIPSNLTDDIYWNS